MLEAGVARVAAKVNGLLGLLRALLERFIGRHGLAIVTPPVRRGSHLALCHPEARALCAALVRAKVVVDFRPSDAIRMAVTPLTTTHREIVEAAARLERILEANDWRNVEIPGHAET